MQRTMSQPHSPNVETVRSFGWDVLAEHYEQTLLAAMGHAKD